MIIKCRNCNAPLEMKDSHQGVIVCNYCGVQNMLTINKPIPIPKKQPVQFTENKSFPIPENQNFVPQIQEAIDQRKKNVGGIIGLSLFVFIIIVIVGLCSSGIFTTTVFKNWYSAGCMVDANGDNVFDLAGWSGGPENQRNLTIIDGLNGKIIWEGESYKNEDNVLCFNNLYFAVGKNDFTIDVFNAKNPSKKTVVTFSDVVESYGSGDNCVQLKTRDNNVYGLQFPDLVNSPCTPIKTRRIYDNEGVASITDDVMSVYDVNVLYTVKHREPGTPLLIFAAQVLQPYNTLWSSEINFVPSSSSLALVVTPEMVVSWGQPVNDNDNGYIIGIDKQTGVVRYAISQESTWSDNIRAMYYNGRYVISFWGISIHAYDPLTGEEAWSIGSR